MSALLKIDYRNFGGKQLV